MPVQYRIDFRLDQPRGSNKDRKKTPKLRTSPGGQMESTALRAREEEKTSVKLKDESANIATLNDNQSAKTSKLNDNQSAKTSKLNDNQSAKTSTLNDNQSVAHDPKVNLGGDKGSAGQRVKQNGLKHGGLAKKSGAVEKVVLPAGLCVFYARGSGSSLMQTNPQQSKGKPPHKSLGVVDPVCASHSQVEEEYAIIREVVEIYLEKQVCGGEEGNRYRAGGQLQDQRQLLDSLAQSLPADSEAHEAETTPLPDLQPSANSDPEASAEDKLVSGAKTARRNLLPISTALATSRSTLGQFLVEGQRVQDTPREGSLPDAAPAQPPVEKWLQESVPPPKDRLLAVARIPLSPRPEDNEPEELRRGFENVRTVNQHYPDPVLTAKKEKKRRKNKSPFHFIPSGHTPLQLVSEKSPMEARVSYRHRGNVGMTPDKAERLEEQPALKGEPPSQAFQVKDKKPWRPLVSRLGASPSPALAKYRQQQAEGRSFVTRGPSKMILKVVLPREVKSRDSRLCSRHSSHHSREAESGQRLQGWMGSPPPPPPPSAPSAEDQALVGDAATETGFHDAQPGDEEGFADDEDDYEEEQDRNEDDEDDDRTDDRVSGDRLERYRNDTTFSQHSASPALKTSNAIGDCANQNPELYNTRRKPIHDTTSTATHSPHEGYASTKIPPLHLDQPDHENHRKNFLPDRGSADTEKELGSLSMQRKAWSCQRAVHCDLFGPDLCADCEAQYQRKHFTARQHLLYPHIDVFPRSMVATQRLRPKFLPRSDLTCGSSGAVVARSRRWPYTSQAALNNVVTDLDLCRRVVDRGHRAKLPATYT